MCYNFRVLGEELDMGRSIYTYNESDLLSKEGLSKLLNDSLNGKSLAGLPLRTRSKVLKTLICKALNYDIPPSFSKTKPKFPCQLFDVYIQKSNNLQIWNDEISKDRRYVLIQINGEDLIKKVKVIDGEDLKKLDTTGKLTIKYQAKVPSNFSGTKYTADDQTLSLLIREPTIVSRSSLEPPTANSIKSICSLYKLLVPLIGDSIKTQNLVQERTIADVAQELVCKKLGYTICKDDGQFPDIPNQLLEVKLQMSSTIDLGLHRPDSDEETNYSIGKTKIKVSMCRYLVIIAHRNNSDVIIDDLVITSGKRFFDIFTLFGGKVTNAKLQIPLPSNFWD